MSLANRIDYLLSHTLFNFKVSIKKNPTEKEGYITLNRRKPDKAIYECFDISTKHIKGHMDYETALNLVISQFEDTINDSRKVLEIGEVYHLHFVSRGKYLQEMD